MGGMLRLVEERAKLEHSLIHMGSFALLTKLTCIHTAVPYRFSTQVNCREQKDESDEVES